MLIIEIQKIYLNYIRFIFGIIYGIIYLITFYHQLQYNNNLVS
jgi:hypothetical protein